MLKQTLISGVSTAICTFLAGAACIIGYYVGENIYYAIDEKISERKCKKQKELEDYIMDEEA